MKNEDIIIAGGGAAGLMAAVFAGEYAPAGTRITVIEHKESAGKKLLATGNGRCNFSNDLIDSMSYRGNDSTFAYDLIARYNRDWLLETMRDIGMLHTSVNGYYYPRSMQARTVVDCLISRLKKLGVDIVCNTHIDEVHKSDDRYRIICNEEDYTCTKLILAMGGCSYSSLGSDGSGYKVLKKLGHTVSDLFPSLIGLRAQGIDFKCCQGVRAKGKLSLYADGDSIAISQGEIQFAEYGVSGIPVFQLSRYASEALIQGKNVTLSIDLIPEYSKSELVHIINDLADHNMTKSAVELLNGIIPYKLARALLVRLGISCEQASEMLSKKQCAEIADIVKNLTIKIKGDCGFDKAQVTAGGLLTGELNPDTMESLLHSGLYVAGELIDIDGNCGGYNLHFAFASGAVAGMNAALWL